MTVKVIDYDTEKQLLQNSESYFAQRVFGYVVAAHHKRMIDHAVNHQRSLILSPRGSGKTKINTISHIAFKILNNANERLLLLSDTHNHATRFLGSIKAVLSMSPVVKEYYGDVIGSKWTDMEITTSRRTDESITEASLTATGIYGSYVTSGHFTEIVCDDLITFENSASLLQRTRMEDRFKTTLLPTLLPNAPIRVIGCLPGDTNILMADNSWKKIQKIERGEKVYTFDDGRLSTENVDNVIFQGPDEILEIQTQRSKIKTNPTHPFLVVSPTTEKKFDSRRYSDIYDFEFQWKKAADLKKNDAILTINTIEAGNEIHSTDFAWLLGFMTGDGWLTKNERTNGLTNKKYTTWKICFAAGIDNTLNNKVVSLFEKLFSLKLVYKPAERYYLGTSKRVGDFIFRAGLKQGAKEKDIPAWIFLGSLKIRLAFIKGLLEADGWKQKYSSKSYSIESSSEKLITSLNLLCMISGLLTSNIFYRSRYIQPPNSPAPVFSETWHINISYNSNYGMYRLKEKALKKFPFQNFRFETVQKVTQTGAEDVWDLTVHKTHNFIAEGFVTHNTRYHFNDLYGFLIKTLKYETLLMPAIINMGTQHERSIWPDFMPLHSTAANGVKIKGLHEIKEDIGSLIFELQYQNRTTFQESGSIFKWEWFNFYTETPPRLQIYQAADLAISKKDSSDYFVLITIGIDSAGNIFVLDIFRKRGISFNSQVEVIIQKAEEFKPLKVGIETNGYQAALSQEVKRLTLLPVIELTTTKDKVLRAQKRSGIVESGRVYVRQDMHDFVSELVLFSDTTGVDDQFDAFDFALTVAETQIKTRRQNGYFLPVFK